MAFVDRVVEYPGRVTLTAVSGQTDTYDVTRNEGDVTTGGTLLNATNLNAMTQVDDDVVTELTTAGMTSGTYQNDMSDALDYLLQESIPSTSSNIAAGRISAVTVASGSYADATVTFGKTFSTAPIVVTTFFSTSTGSGFGRCTLSVYDVTTTGCKIRIFNGDSVSRAPALFYIAISV